jgi:hypothetical protein
VSKQTIEERINNALNNGSTGSATLSELIKETESAIAAAPTVAEQEHAKALDLATSDPDKSQASARAATLKRDRLAPTLARLKDKLSEALDGERHARWLVSYQRAEVELEALAKEFADVYLTVSTQLVDLFSRMRQFDHRSAGINSMASDIAGEHRRLPHVERHARAAQSNGGASGPDLLPNIQLPDLHASRNMLWPPRQPSVASAFAMMPTPAAASPHAHTADWWKDGDARSAQLRREAQETERFYTAQHETAEARANAEVRERIAADRAAKMATQRR